MGATPSTSSNAVISEKIDQLRGEICQLNGKLDALAKGVQEYQLVHTAEFVKVVESAHAAHRRLDEHGSRIKTLEDYQQAIRLELGNIGHSMKILIGVVSFIALSVGGYVVSAILKAAFP